MDGWTETEGWMYGRAKTEGWMDRQTETDGWTNGWTDGRMDGLMDDPNGFLFRKRRIYSDCSLGDLTILVKNR